MKGFKSLFNFTSTTTAANTNSPSPPPILRREASNSCLGGKIVFDKNDESKPPCAVIVTIKSGSSYDDLYTTTPQVSPDETVAVKVFHFNYATIPDILRCISGQPCESASAELSQVIHDMLACRSQVDPDSFVVNFECCSGCSCSGFDEGDAESVQRLLAWMIEQKHVAMFADFSLKSLIAEWSVAIMGPNPFANIGDTCHNLSLTFDPEKLLESPNTQLQNLSRMCNTGKAYIGVMPQTIVFTVDETKAKTDAYELEILSVVTPSSGGRRGGGGSSTSSVGHAILRYPTGACILVSAGHWIELTHLDGVNEETLIATTEMSMGCAEADDLRCELNSATTAVARASVVQKRAKRTLLASAPCKYSSSKS